MAILEFPPHSDADEEGLLAIGGDLEVNSLLLAYKNGIFPWPLGKKNLLAWFSPPLRTIIEPKTFKTHKALKKLLKDPEVTITHDNAFHEVIAECASIKRPKASGTWISQEIITGYRALFEAGYGFSTEVWRKDKLIAGVYGVHIGRYFAGESMFHKEDNCSKLAIYSLLARITHEGGTFLDCQVMNPFLESLGAFEITRKEFLERLKGHIET